MVQRLQRDLEESAQELGQTQEELTQVSAAATAMQAQADMLKAQLKDARANSNMLQGLVQVCLCLTFDFLGFRRFI